MTFDSEASKSVKKYKIDIFDSGVKSVKNTNLIGAVRCQKMGCQIPLYI